MISEDNKAFVRQYLSDITRDKSEATVNRYIADESLKQHIKMFEMAFPGYQLSEEDMIAEGDKVVLRSIMTGTHRGTIMGIPPTGKQVSVPLMLIYRISGGKIVQFWMNADTFGMLQQLGVNANNLATAAR